MATAMTWQKAKMERKRSNEMLYSKGGYSRFAKTNKVNDRRNGGSRNLEVTTPKVALRAEGDVAAQHDYRGRSTVCEPKWANGLSEDVGRMGSRKATGRAAPLETTSKFNRGLGCNLKGYFADADRWNVRLAFVHPAAHSRVERKIKRFDDDLALGRIAHRLFGVLPVGSFGQAHGPRRETELMIRGHGWFLIRRRCCATRAELLDVNSTAKVIASCYPSLHAAAIGRRFEGP